jgi:hypothetical protein
MTATITRSGLVEFGTRLYHEVHGSGPALLLIAGGIGDFKKARGQVHETFLPTGEFKFVFILTL